jgi:type IV pilus assembly protein PilM
MSDLQDLDPREDGENPPAEKVSFWKKEISFRRSRDTEPAEAPQPVEEAVAPEPEPTRAAPAEARAHVEDVAVPEPELELEPEPVDFPQPVELPQPVEAPAPFEPAAQDVPEVAGGHSSSLEDLIALAMADVAERPVEAPQQEFTPRPVVEPPVVEPPAFQPPAPEPPAFQPPAAEVPEDEVPVAEAPEPEAELPVVEPPMPEAPSAADERPAPVELPPAAVEAPQGEPTEVLAAEPMTYEFREADDELPADVANASAAESVEEPAPDASPGKKEKKKKKDKRGRKSAGAEKAKARRGFSFGGHRAKKIVGLKIGASKLSAAYVSNNGNASLMQVAHEPLESGVVVGGELRDPEALAVALKSFFRKHKLPRRNVRLGISNNRIGVRIFDIPEMEGPEQLRNAVRFRAQEALPISLDEAVLDYHIVGESVDAEGARQHRVVLVVAYRDLIERYANACRKAGIKLLGVDLEVFGVLRALGTDAPVTEQGERTGLVVASVGHERSTFAVSDGDVCEFTRLVEWGGFSLDVAIARALDLTPSEAGKIKRGLSLSNDETVPEGVSPQDAEKARQAIRRELDSFARDLVSSLRFYQNQPGSLAISELVLTGGTSALEGLDAELERLIGVRVRVGEPFGRVQVGRKLKATEDLGSLTAAIGLGIEV